MLSGKLIFFIPESSKKCFVVISFGSKNSPFFYTGMMKILQDKLIIIFNDTKYIVQLNTSLINIFCNDKTIINDTLLYFNHIPTLFHYFSCVDQVFTRYKIPYLLSKYNFFLPHIEYVGHDLIVGGNYPTQFKFQLIKHLILPPHGVSFSLSLSCVFSTVIMLHGLN